MGISIVLLAYKEEKNLRFLLPKIIENVQKLKEKYEIIVVDTAEPMDNTMKVCHEYGVKYINQEYPNYGGAFKTGVKHASMSYYLMMDSDGSHDPQKIPEIYKKIIEENCDVVIGSRYVKGGHTEDVKTSIFMSKILNLTVRILLGIKAKDISTSFRIYHTNQLKEVKLERKNYDVLQEVLVRLRTNKPNLIIVETPISFSKRVFGKSKRKLIPFIITYVQFLFKEFFIQNQFLKHLFLYGFFGLLAAALEYSVFSMFIYLEVFKNPVTSNIFAALCGFAFSFLTNTFLNFKKQDKIFIRLLSYGIICFVGIGFSSLIIYILQDTMNLYILKASLMVIVSFVQFILNRNITYGN